MILGKLHIEKPRLAILAGRPGMGKTSLVCSLLWDCIDMNEPAIMFSMEHRRQEIEEKYFLSNCIDVPRDLILIDDTPNVSLDYCEQVIENFKKKHDVRFVIIDYLQLVAPNQYETRISKTMADRLRSMSSNLNCFILVTYQAPKGIEERKNRRPMLRDFDIYGENDDVLFLYRDDYYSQIDWTDAEWEKYLDEWNKQFINMTDKEMADFISDEHIYPAELIIAKSEVVPVETITLFFNDSKLLFSTDIFELI